MYSSFLHIQNNLKTFSCGNIFNMHVSAIVELKENIKKGTLFEKWIIRSGG